MDEIELGLTGIPNKDNILNIGRSRMRATYLRPDGNLTTPLPADPYSVTYYFGKGFKAPPKETPKTEVVSEVVQGGTVRCPFCTFEAKGAQGLKMHLNIHLKSNKEVK